MAKRIVAAGTEIITKLSVGDTVVDTNDNEIKDNYCALNQGHALQRPDHTVAISRYNPITNSTEQIVLSIDEIRALSGVLDTCLHDHDNEPASDCLDGVTAADLALVDEEFDTEG